MPLAAPRSEEQKSLLNVEFPSEREEGTAASRDEGVVDIVSPNNNRTAVITNNNYAENRISSSGSEDIRPNNDIFEIAEDLTTRSTKLVESSLSLFSIGSNPCA